MNANFEHIIQIRQAAYENFYLDIQTGWVNSEILERKTTRQREREKERRKKILRLNVWIDERDEKRAA